MTYATVMVGLALDRSNDACLEIARETAERFDAHVIGITAAQFSPPLYFTDGNQAQELLDQGRAEISNRVAALEAQFRKALHSRSDRLEWRSAEDFPARYIVQQARAADILIVGQDGGGGLGDPFEKASPSDLLMQAGRPLLVVPDAGTWLDLRSVLVAWKDTTEARRAISDALPLLRKARDVTVAELIDDETRRPAAQARLDDVVGWLSRHGVTARAQVANDHGHTAKQLESIAADVGAGLIVAGAYGHSRFREWVLGGVTRQLVNPSTRCSLLSR
ncbi:universal stress protein [Rhodopseudomonas sp. P2A-2r]|uniref:universal stress protein n=1 Tax=unclassified Rhodopseudomonas TaxID=2638247 RepID=UPI002234E858|nr:universal stress protein [Rhodopseudomonas sp. P2A-2r]UZE49331.1 universal stress protein [Rhodopseudomonas sp. P2A-2r]